MSCEACGSGNTASLGMSGLQHIYCHKCGSHKYDGRLIDRKTWDSWVNGEVKLPDMFFDRIHALPIVTADQPIGRFSGNK